MDRKAPEDTLIRGWTGFTPKTIETFGGLVTFLDRLDLPPNVSPSNSNIIYGRGTIGSRKGTTVLSGTPLALNYVNGMFNYLPIDGTKHLMAFSAGDSAGGSASGTLYYEASAGSWTAVSNTMGYTAAAPMYMFGDTHYGRAWMAFHDGNYGLSHPRKFDGTTLSRIGTERPSWNGTTAEVAGTGAFDAGVHRVRVTFETDAGFATPPSKVGVVTSTGNAATGLQLQFLPLGPTGTIRRVVWMATITDSAATDPTGFAGTTLKYYTLRNTNWVIPDNTSTTWTIDGFTDARISTGESLLLDRNWTIAPLPPCAGMVFYKGRYFYWGALGSIQPEYVSAAAMDNYNFDGGTTAGSIPYGWVSTSVGGAITAGVSGATGSVWRMTGSGAATVGGITQIANGVHPYSMFTPGINYGVRIRCKKNAALTAGTLRLTSTINAVVTTFDTAVSTMSQTFQNFSSGTTAFITGHTNSGDAGPNPIKVELVGTPTNGGICDLDWLDFYDVLKPTQGSRVFCTSIDQPETIDAVTGIIDVSPNDGQTIHSAFVLRDNLYFVKDRSIYVTSDNQTTEPSGWRVDRHDDVIGTAFGQGVAQGEGWVVIAARSGLYYFDGGISKKLTQEIQPDWDLINWPQPGLWPPLDVKIDVEQKRIYLELSVSLSAVCNKLYVMDFLEGFSDPISGSLVNPNVPSGIGRKWTIWAGNNVIGNSLCLAERASGRRLLFFGTNDLTGNITYYDTTVVNDGAGAISSSYVTSALGLPEGVTSFGGILFWVGGSGTFTINKQIPVGTITQLGTFTLANPAVNNLQLLQNDHYERLSYQFTTNGVGAWFSMNRFTPYLRPDPFFNIRGYNP